MRDVKAATAAVANLILCRVRMRQHASYLDALPPTSGRPTPCQERRGLGDGGCLPRASCIESVGETKGDAGS
ncbi:hypothetical protein KC326_g20 [Hortaea werneckii]|nr:hypothetical protein KC326_g20 [Hortaea werneckii]